MRKDDVFPSKYLKCADLNGNPVTVTIEHAPLETLKSPEGKEQNKIVLYFRGAKKTLPLNLTNWDSVSDICGDDTEDWPGNKIELYPAKTQMGGKTVDLHSYSSTAVRKAKTNGDIKAAAGRGIGRRSTFLNH